MFKDRVVLYARAGDGGDGAASFRREKFVPRGGPDGGDGGNGGNVVLEADPQVDSLVDLYFRPHARAQHGGRGRGKKMHGKDGAECRLRVPCGTVIRDGESGEVEGELVEAGDERVVARGGRGGLGNCHFTSSTNRAPRRFTPGGPGDERRLTIELKIVAHAGLVGYPNAGKSTLLSRISAAKPKVAGYPFTTLNPIIGTVKFDDYTSVRVADIPGLIDGAHEGVGLGFDFLRHIERTEVLLFVLDMAGSEGRDPVEDYQRLRGELRCYREDLDERPRLILANKMDLPEADDNLKRFRAGTDESVLPLSAAAGEGLDAVRSWLAGHFSKDLSRRADS
ncbi:GTPase ObgE [Kiritimatiella glycovorans]|uniref:GTPase Obg n=1 Tax=Kiritimatiella glycovorans TaxID=1307763 RepID=A0A0G3EB46_9BACT|nr:GTPase ObgE [Kiritimatiella glycovorans]AKJ63513.1 GTP-binding protein obg [Kiritimatiella glycovorans]